MITALEAILNVIAVIVGMIIILGFVACVLAICGVALSTLAAPFVMLAVRLRRH